MLRLLCSCTQHVPGEPLPVFVNADHLHAAMLLYATLGSPNGRMARVGVVLNTLDSANLRVQPACCELGNDESV